MMRQTLKSTKGITLVELLAALAIISLLSVLIIGYLVGGMNSFTRTNTDIAIHDEANYVMSQFVNYIFVAKNVEQQSDSIIVVKDFEDQEISLGFKENNAVINDETIQQSRYKFLDESKIEVKDNKVEITIFIQDQKSKNNKSLRLESEVSFVKVD